MKDIEVLHGDIPQQQREITFRGFKEGRFHILVATDVASRGLDIPDVDLIVQCEPPKDVETYIHRSGRTARAGKEGTVVTFYGKKHIPLISRIESRAGITFAKIGAPQPEDIIKASSKFIIEGLKKVNDDALPLFTETADLLVKEFGEKKALLLTLAYISGNLSKIKKRSLLSGTEDFITYQLDTDKDFRTVSYVWGILRRILPNDDAEQIRNMRCFKNNMGAAFDVPEKLTNIFETSYGAEKSAHKFMSYSIKRATELPDLKELEPFNKDFVRNHVRARSKERSRSPSYRRHSPSHSRGHNKSKSKSKSKSRSKSKSHTKHNNDDHRRNESKFQRPPQERNDIFVWGLKTEDDIKDFLTDNKIGWQRIKVLKGNIIFYSNKIDEKGESKLVSFITVDKDEIESLLKLDGTRVGKRELKISKASDKPKK